jgi:hypothetical protein
VAVEKTRDGRWGRPLTDDVRAGHLWRPLRKLYRKAKDARQRGMAEEMLGKQRAGLPSNGQAASFATMPTRTYSPNANPMFGHPQRPEITRAPLSRAQLQRFTQGPTFGEMPLDKHQLLKSPRLLETADGLEVDPIDTVGTSTANGGDSNGHSQAQELNGASLRRDMAYGQVDPQQQQNYAQGTRTSNMNSQMFNPTAKRDTSWVAGGPQFVHNLNSVDFASEPGTTAMDLSGIVAPSTSASAGPNYEPMMRMDSIDSQGYPDLNDPNGLMDTSTGDVNWENWDELVRQFGMDVDTTFDRRPGDPTFDVGPVQDSDATMWNMAPTGNAMQTNSRMGMGMGGTEWY